MAFMRTNTINYKPQIITEPGGLLDESEEEEFIPKKEAQ